jgi:hypothetical protein
VQDYHVEPRYLVLTQIWPYKRSGECCALERHHGVMSGRAEAVSARAHLLTREAVTRCRSWSRCQTDIPFPTHSVVYIDFGVAR